MPFKCHEIYFELSLKLKDLHLLVNFHASVFSAHASIKKFIEIYETFVALDTHLKNMLLKVIFVKVVITKTETCFFVTIFSKFLKEFSQLIFLDFCAIVTFLCKLLPYFHEGIHIIFEIFNNIVFWKIIMLKLLDNNKNKEIEHDMRAYKY